MRVFKRSVSLVLIAGLAMVCNLPAVAQQSPEAFVAELYGPRLQAVRLTRDLADDLELAQAMFDDAAGISGSPAIQRLLYQHVTELAVGSIAAADLAERALKQLDLLDPVEAAKSDATATATATDDPALVRARRRVEFYERQIKAAGPAETVKLTDRHLLALMEAGDAAMDVYQPREALRQYNAAKLLASRIMGLDRSPIEARMRVAQESSRAEAQQLTLERALERKPTAAGAAALARIHLTEGRNVAKALRYATHAEDEALVTNLKRLEKPMGELSPDDAAALADWLSAEANSTTERGRMYLIPKAIEAIEHWQQADTANDRLRLAMQHKLLNLRRRVPSLPRLTVPSFAPMERNRIVSGRAVILPGNQRSRGAELAAALALADPGQTVGGRPFEEMIVWGNTAPRAEPGESIIFAAVVFSPKAQRVTLSGFAETTSASWEFYNGREVVRRAGAQITLQEGINVIGAFEYSLRNSSRMALALDGEGLEVRLPSWSVPPPMELPGVTWRAAPADRPQIVDTGLRIGPFNSSAEGLLAVQRYLHGDVAALKGATVKPATFKELTPIIEGRAEVAVMAVRCDVMTTLTDSPRWARGMGAVVNGMPALDSTPELRPGLNIILYAMDDVIGIRNGRPERQMMGRWYTATTGDVAVWPDP